MMEIVNVELSKFAKSLEVVGDHLDRKVNGLDVYGSEEASFLIATLSLPNGQYTPWNLGRLELEGPDFYEQQRDDERVFINERRTMFIINRPVFGQWRAVFSAVNDDFPVAINMMAFFGTGGPLSAVGTVTVSCRSCKMVAKALAVSIVAVTTLPAIPHALIAAVAAYLGVGNVIAAAFIGSVVGDTANMIAEKLCKRVGLC